MILSQEDIECAFDGEPIDIRADDAAAWIISNQNVWFEAVELRVLIDVLLPIGWSSISLHILDRDEHTIIKEVLSRPEAVQHIFDYCNEYGFDISSFDRSFRIQV